MLWFGKISSAGILYISSKWFYLTLCREVGKDASDDLGILDYTSNKSYIAERKALILQWEDHQISSREFVKRTAASNHSDEFDLSSSMHLFRFLWCNIYSQSILKSPRRINMKSQKRNKISHHLKRILLSLSHKGKKKGKIKFYMKITES